MKAGIPNYKHYILKRLPDEDGKICWSLSPERGESSWTYKWDMEELRKEAAKLKVGETKTLFVR